MIIDNPANFVSPWRPSGHIPPTSIADGISILPRKPSEMKLSIELVSSACPKPLNRATLSVTVSSCLQGVGQCFLQCATWQAWATLGPGRAGHTGNPSLRNLRPDAAVAKLAESLEAGSAIIGHR
jgi:hypothetical protein